MVDLKIISENLEFKQARDRFRADASAVIDEFYGMKKAAMQNPSLDGPTKALIAVLLAVARQSERCILTHAEDAVTAGVTRDQLIGGLGLAVVFGGAPGYGLASFALNTYDTFAAKNAVT